LWRPSAPAAHVTVELDEHDERGCLMCAISAYRVRRQTPGGLVGDVGEPATSRRAGANI